MLLNTYTKKKFFISKAISNSLIILNDEFLPDVLFDKLFKVIDINNIPDRMLLSNQRIRKRIDWNKLEKFKLIRTVVRDISILNLIDIKKYNFSIMELLPILIVSPDKIDLFDIDFNSLTNKEVIRLLECSTDFIYRIDLKNFRFNKAETTEIVKKFGNDEGIMENIQLDELDNFVLRNLLIKSGEKYINQINLKLLNSSDWLSILEAQPGLLEHCNLLLFETGDYYHLVCLVLIFPHLYDLIEENKDKIIAIGWEKLLINDFDKYSKICNWSVLTKKHFETIADSRPELATILRQYY